MSKAPSMWERYQNRAAVRPSDRHTQKLGDMQIAANTNNEMLQQILEMLTDHAANIDALKMQIKEVQGFMDWASTTHESIFREYDALNNIGEPKE